MASPRFTASVNNPMPGEAAFAAAVESVRTVRLRPEILIEETPAPQRLAPFAVAITADVFDRPVPHAQPNSLTSPPDDDFDDVEPMATGRLVLLHDPAGHEAWQGVFRVVTYVRASLEPEMALDPMLPSVGWAWLTESLDAHGANYTAAGGTVTRVLSEPFGSMAADEASAQVEIRASWTPLPDPSSGYSDGFDGNPIDVGPHVRAWADLLAEAGGLPPLPPGVVALPVTRRES